MVNNFPSLVHEYCIIRCFHICLGLHRVSQSLQVYDDALTCIDVEYTFDFFWGFY